MKCKHVQTVMYITDTPTQLRMTGSTVLSDMFITFNFWESISMQVFLQRVWIFYCHLG